jgi:hypothetical protein
MAKQNSKPENNFIHIPSVPDSPHMRGVPESVHAEMVPYMENDTDD